MNPDYIINPVMMGGIINGFDGEYAKINLFGRLGVIKIKPELIDGNAELGSILEFYFSYIQVVKDPYDYDASQMVAGGEINPSLLGGKIIEVNDTAVMVSIMNNIGTVAVPRRWVFTSMVLEVGEDVEFYFSPMRIIGKSSVQSNPIKEEN